MAGAIAHSIALHDALVAVKIPGRRSAHQHIHAAKLPSSSFTARAASATLSGFGTGYRPRSMASPPGSRRQKPDRAPSPNRNFRIKIMARQPDDKPAGFKSDTARLSRTRTAAGRDQSHRDRDRREGLRVGSPANVSIAASNPGTFNHPSRRRAPRPPCRSRQHPASARPWSHRYWASDPGAKPFIEVGTKVSVEDAADHRAMKTMNQIHHRRGHVTQISYRRRHRRLANRW